VSYSIYAIVDPRSREIFYIGRTDSPERRFAEHIEGTHQLSGIVVQQIKEAGFLPHFIVLERCESLGHTCMAEIFWIETLQSRGAKLTNAQATGGYVGRAKERKRMTAELDAMRDAKRPSRILNDLSNGRPVRSYKPWTKLDVARLKGMKQKKCSPEYMADKLERSLTEINEKLKSLPGSGSSGARRRRRKDDR